MVQKERMCKDTVHVGAEAVTSEPERGDDSPEAARLISHPSLSALAPPENHLSTEPLQTERSGCWPVCMPAPRVGGLECGMVNPQRCRGDTQLEGAVIGEVLIVAGGFAMSLYTLGLALRLQGSQTISIRLPGDSRWESDLLRIWK